MRQKQEGRTKRQKKTQNKKKVWHKADRSIHKTGTRLNKIFIYFLKNAICWTIGNSPLHQHDMHSLLNCRCFIYDLLLFQVGGKIFLQQTSILPRVERHAPKHRGPPGNLRPLRRELHSSGIFTRDGNLFKHALDNVDTCCTVCSVCVGICWSWSYVPLFSSK